MPLRDHFRPPVSRQSSWAGFHAMWPTLRLWLTDALVIPLDLERSYEQACHDLWIT